MRKISFLCAVAFLPVSAFGAAQTVPIRVPLWGAIFISASPPALQDRALLGLEFKSPLAAAAPEPPRLEAPALSQASWERTTVELAGRPEERGAYLAARRVARELKALSFDARLEELDNLQTGASTPWGRGGVERYRRLLSDAGELVLKAAVEPRRAADRMRLGELYAERYPAGRGGTVRDAAQRAAAWYRSALRQNLAEARPDPVLAGLIQHKLGQLYEWGVRPGDHARALRHYTEGARLEDEASRAALVRLTRRPL